jgi:large exoprotein involved in heme utilization and adhesion
VVISGVSKGQYALIWAVAGEGPTGEGGSIRITATNNLQVKNSGHISVATWGQGNGGNIELSGNQIQLLNGASIGAESSGTGNAGDIGINARNTLQMENSSIATEAKQADGGNLQIKAGYMVNLIDSKITASVKGGPQTTGGNITIDPRYVVLNDSQIIAKATEGRGGNIKINADVFLASPESSVDAHSDRGISGTVDIRAAINSITQTLVPIQGNFLSAAELLRDRCSAKIRGEKYSSFVVSGRDGLPIRPGSVLPSPIY